MSKTKKTKDGLLNSRGEAILVCPPDKAGRSLPVRIFGIAFRAIVALFAVFGLALLFSDAVNLPITAASLFGVSALAVTYFSLFFIPKAGPYIGTGVTVGYIVLRVILDNEYFRFVPASLLTLYNSFLERLTGKNFIRMADFMVDVDDSGFSRFELQKYGMVLLIILLAAAFVPCIIKKTHILIPAAVSTLLLCVIFTYNMSNNNWAFALIIASFCSIIVLSTYDRYYIKDPEKFRNTAERRLFGAGDRPKLPPEAAAQEEIRNRLKAEKQARKQKKSQLRSMRRNNTLTVEDEISSYFEVPSSGKSKKVRNAPSAGELALRQHSKAIKAQVRKVRNYDRSVAGAKSAMGGFAAIGTFILMMLILAFPALLTDSSFTEIPGISNRMDYYREFLTAFLQGDDVVLDDLEYARVNSNFKPRSTDATPRVYDGTQYFFIETASPTDIYLTGWIGTDYRNGSWYTAEYRDETNIAYRSLYASSYNRTSTPSESLYFNFMKAYMPYDMRKVEFEDNRQIANSAHGFVAEQVNIRRLSTIGTQGYFPSRFYNEYKLREYGKRYESDINYVNFFDGIYTGNGFGELEAEYAVVSYLMTQTNQNWYRNIASYIAEFNEGYSVAYKKVLYPRREKISYYRDRETTLSLIVNNIYTEVSVRNTSGNKYTVVIPSGYKGAGEYIVEKPIAEDSPTVVWFYGGNTRYEISSEGEVIKSRINSGVQSSMPELPFAVRYCSMMSNAEKLQIASMYYDYFIYSNYVYDTYTGVAGSEIITDYYNGIMDGLTADEKKELLTDGNGASVLPYGKNSISEVTYENRHELIMKIISTLADKDSGYTYTLTPEATPDANLDGVENFLTVTKEGYCVQFASSVVLLLREAGIPARYVEGYAASDFMKYQTRDPEWSWYSIVKDENAHAWVEVWFDGIGWIRYEATPSLYNEAYGIQETISPDDTTTEPPETTTEPVDSTTEDTTTEPPVTTTDATATVSSVDPADDSPKDTGGSPGRRIDPEVIIRICIIVGSVLVAATAIAVAVIFISRRAERHRKLKEALLERAENRAVPENERHETARKLIDMTMMLLKLYGTPPGKSEPRRNYARRLEKEYLDVFGKQKRNPERTKPGDPEFITVSDTDFTALFDAIAAEEFGTDGMTADDMAALAVFYKRLYRAMPVRMSGFTIFKHRYFRFI